MDLSHAIFVYLEWKEVDRPAAGRYYKKPLLDFAEHVGKHLEAVAMGDIMLFKKFISGKFAPSTCWYYVTVLRGFLTYWQEEGIVTMNVRRISLPRFRLNPYHAVTEEEFDLIDGYLETEPENFANRQKRLIVRLLWETGLRVSELCGIKHGNIQSGKVQVDTEKNDLRRWVFWSAETSQLLETFLAERRKYLGHTLFTTTNGAMNPKCVQRMVKDVTARLGIGNVVPHSFRHGKAHRILRKGGSLVDVQHILGHKNVLSTQRYTQWEPTELSERAERFLT